MRKVRVNTQLLRVLGEVAPLKPYEMEYHKDQEFWGVFNHPGYQFDFITFAMSTPGKLSGMSQNNWKCGRPPIETTREERGTYLKPGKFVKYCSNVTKKELPTVTAQFVRLLFKELGEGLELKISDCVGDIYTMEHINRGSTGSSCMRGKPKELFELYDILGAKILYIEDEGKLNSRAILWDNLKDKDGNTFKAMDRIYSSNSNYELLFERWAKEHGYLVKENNSADEFNLRVPCDSKVIRGMFSIDVDISLNPTHLPYLDTFPFYDKKRKKLHNHYNETLNDDAILQSLNGGDIDGLFRGVYVCLCGKRHNHVGMYVSTDTWDCYLCEECTETQQVSKCKECSDKFIPEKDGQEFCSNICFSYHENMSSLREEREEAVPIVANANSNPTGHIQQAVWGAWNDVVVMQGSPARPTSIIMEEYNDEGGNRRDDPEISDPEGN